MIGKTISYYKIIEKLGGGGMGVVYKAEDTKLDRIVALKFLPTAFSLDKEAKQRFINEAKTASSLQHNNICTIHDIDETDEGQLFISMDLYEGITLKQKIERSALKTEEAIDISIQVAEGLSKAHAKKIIHRDIKPANIFITKDEVTKILDFGLAKSGAYANITKMDSTKGTIAYISPEQAQGKEATNKSDIWSLGVVMYEMLTSHLPFKGEYDQVIIYSILDKKPEEITKLNPKIPLGLEQIVSRALEKDIDSRYQSIDEMLADLHRLKQKSSISKNTVSAVKQNKNKKSIKTAIISSLILVFAFAAFYLIRPILFGEDKTNIPISIAVVGFENQSGDSTYNYLQKAIPNLLITNLEQSNHLQVTTWERMHDLLKQMNENDVELINKDLGFEICRLEGIDAIVIGSFVKAGNVFATDVKVLDARTKKLIKSANVKSEGLAGILESQIDYLSEEIVKGVVQSAGEIESVQLRIADVSTTSMEAYKQFLKGKEEFERIYYYEALEHFERAIQIDSTFALAHLYLGLTQYYVYEVKKFKNSFSNAEKYKNTATERERIYIEALYYFMIGKNIDNSINILEKGVTKYPNEKMMYFWLAYNYYRQRKYSDVLIELTKVLKLDPNYGLAYKLIGKTYGEKGDFEKALDYTKKYISIYPQNADSYYSLGFLFFRMGKIDQAIDQLKMSFQIKEDFGPSAILATLFSLKEDYSETLRWEKKISSLWNKESMNFASTWWRSFYYYWTGNIKKTLFTLEKMLRENSQIEAIWIARANWLRGWIYYDRGDYEKSRQYFNRFLNQEYKNRYGLDTAYISTMNYFYKGIVGLKMGKIDSVRINLEQMKSISNEINTDYPYNIRSYYNLLYGMVLIKEDSLNKAEDILKNNPPFKLHPQRLSAWGMISIFIDPLLQDGLARIYAKKGDLDKAIDVYEELISQDLEVRGFHLIHPKYHYRLAKLYEEKGRMEKAISEYEKFLKIYINADKDLPDYIDAKRRLSKLVAK